MTDGGDKGRRSGMRGEFRGMKECVRQGLNGSVRDGGMKGEGQDWRERLMDWGGRIGRGSRSDRGRG